jgi:hypothetical protein
MRASVLDVQHNRSGGTPCGVRQEYFQADKAPLRFRGEREGPVAREPSAHGLDPWGWEGEVGDAVNRLGGPPHPSLSPRRRGERVIGLSPDSPVLPQE